MLMFIYMTCLYFGFGLFTRRLFAIGFAHAREKVVIWKALTKHAFLVTKPSSSSMFYGQLSEVELSLFGSCIV